MSKLSLSRQARPDRVWFVTGSSRGIGRALCERVLAGGEQIVCTARDVKALDGMVREFPGRATALPLDVTDSASVNDAVDAAIARHGKIDVLVNNAGYGIVGALEEIDEKEFARAFDTNVYGAYRVTRAVLPHMRARRSGRILNVSSALGVVARGGYCLYNATKFALEGMSEALAHEVAPFGIRVTILEPGSFRTGFRSGGVMYEAPEMDAYKETLGSFRRNLIETDGKQPGDPVRGAEVIVAVANAPDPPLRLPMGEACVDMIRKKLKTTAEELDEWLELSHATSFKENA